MVWPAVANLVDIIRIQAANTAVDLLDAYLNAKKNRRPRGLELADEA